MDGASYFSSREFSGVTAEPFPPQARGEMALRKISKKVLMEAHDLNLWVAIVVRKKSDPCRVQLLAEADRRERKTGRKLLDRLLLPGNAGVVTPYGG